MKSEVEGKAANFSAKLNCDALSDYCIEWIAFFDEKGGAAFDGDKETYRLYKREARPAFISFTEALLELKAVKFKTDEINGEYRYSFHIESQP